jgi:hypothetical protein
MYNNTDKLKIVLIHGKARNGKDTLAEAIIKNTHQYNPTTVSFAQPIKDYLVRYEGWDGKIKDDYWRGRMIHMGTAIGRDMIDKDIWVKVASNIINMLYCSGVRLICIPDLRMENEINSLPIHLSTHKFRNHFDIIVVKVVRDALINNSPLTNEQQSHVTESGLDDYYFDKVIHLPELRSKKSRDNYFNAVYSDKIFSLLTQSEETS